MDYAVKVLHPIRLYLASCRMTPQCFSTLFYEYKRVKALKFIEEEVLDLTEHLSKHGIREATKVRYFPHK